MIKLTSGKTSGRNFLLICSNLLFLLQKHLCQSLHKQAVNLKKQQNNLLSNNNYNVKRLKTVRGFLEEFKSKQLELAKSSRKIQKSIYFHQVRKMWELTAAQTKLFLPPTTSRWLAFFDMEKKEDKMNPFQEAQTVPELRYDEIQVGDQASLTKTITDEDVINFAKLTGDVNPIHILDSFAKTTMFKNVLLTVCSFRVLFLPSLERNSQAKIRFIYPKMFHSVPLSKSVIHFVLWQRLLRSVTIKIITLQTNIYNQSDDIVVEGTATILKRVANLLLFFYQNF